MIASKFRSKIQNTYSYHLFAHHIGRIIGFNWKRIIRGISSRGGMKTFLFTNGLIHWRKSTLKDRLQIIIKYLYSCVLKCVRINNKILIKSFPSFKNVFKKRQTQFTQRIPFGWMTHSWLMSSSFAWHTTLVQKYYHLGLICLKLEWYFF